MTPEEKYELVDQYEMMSDDELMQEYGYLHTDYLTYLKSVNVLLDRKSIIINIMTERKQKVINKDLKELDRISDDGK